MSETYYPSMVVNMTLLFDDTLFVITNQTALNNAKNDDQVFGTGGSVRTKKPRITMGKATVDGPDGIKREVELPEAAQSAQDAQTTPPVQPLVFPESEHRVQVLNRVPKSANVELNGTRQAGKFRLTMDYRDLPIDPRLVRSVGIEIHLGTVPEKQWAFGQEKRTTELGRSLSRLSTRNVAGGINLETLVLQGNVDNWSVTHGEAGSEIVLEGRDIRGLLLDLKLPPETFVDLDLTQSIDNVVAQILFAVPTKFGLLIDVVAPVAEWAPRRGIPSPSTVDGITRVRLDADGKKPRSTPAGATAAGGSGDRISVWDLITKYCSLVGAVPYFYGEQLWIRPARNVVETFDAIKGGTYPIPFKGGERAIKVGDDDGNAIEKFVAVRHLVYGRDIAELSYERNYQRVAAPTIELVSIDDTKRGEEKLLIVQWPPVESRAGKLKDEGQKLRIPMPGIRDANQLLTIAQDLYEEIGRSEQGGSASTRNMSSLGGSNADADMVRMRPSEMIALFTDARALSARRASEPSGVLSFAAEEKAVAWSLDGNPNGVPGKEPSSGSRQLARAIVASSRPGAIFGEALSYYRVSNVKFDWDGSGIRIGFDFRNYMITRQQAALTGVGVKKSGKKKTGVDKQATPVVVPPPAKDNQWVGFFAAKEASLRARFKRLGYTDEQIDRMLQNYVDQQASRALAQDVKIGQRR